MNSSLIKMLLRRLCILLGYTVDISIKFGFSSGTFYEDHIADEAFIFYQIYEKKMIAYFEDFRLMMQEI